MACVAYLLPKFVLSKILPITACQNVNTGLWWILYFISDMVQITFDRSSYETYSDSVEVGVMAIGGNLTDTVYLSISVESLTDSTDSGDTHQYLTSYMSFFHFHYGFLPPES